MTQPTLTFEEFQAELAAALSVPAERLTAGVDFLYDLAFDSLRLLELGMVFERLGVDMPTELAWEIHTVGDAYAYYARSSAHADADG